MRDAKGPSSFTSARASKSEVFKNLSRSALSLAAEHGHPECVRLLCDHGALKPSTDNLGQLPLLLATENRHDGCVQLLLTNGVDPNGMATLEFSGTYALLVAISRLHSNVARSLYQAGARRNVTTANGTSALNTLLRHDTWEYSSRPGSRSSLWSFYDASSYFGFNRDGTHVFLSQELDQMVAHQYEAGYHCLRDACCL